MLIVSASILYLITALLHLSIPIRFKDNKDKMPVAMFGIIYLALGILLLVTSFGWLVMVALIITVIGGAAGTMSYKKNFELRPSVKLFVGIDIVIIALLVAELIVG